MGDGPDAAEDSKSEVERLLEAEGLTGPVHPGDGVLTAVQSLLVIVVVALFIVTFLVQPFRIPSESMEPTLAVGDFLLVNKQAFAPRGWMDAVLPPSPVRRGDVVVFHYPVNPEVHVVKRVVGLPGDRLRLRDGQAVRQRTGGGRAVCVFWRRRFRTAFGTIFRRCTARIANVDPAWWTDDAARCARWRTVYSGGTVLRDGRQPQ